jgi:hypothetical protein
MWHVKGGTTNAYEPSVGKPKETQRLEDLDTNEQIIIKQILNMTRNCGMD